MRLLIQIMVLPASAIAIAAIGWFFFTGSADEFLPYNNFRCVCVVLVLRDSRLGAKAIYQVSGLTKPYSSLPVHSFLPWRACM